MTDDKTTARAQVLFAEHLRDFQVKTDRLMLVLLLAQWVLAVVIAVTFSPYAWSGKVRSVHVHVQVALVLGGLLNSFPVALILLRPGWWFTRQVVATAQMLWSALLIHLTGGRIETHFHIFGSLAYLAFYRDWRLLPTATLVVAGDHLIRGLLWPESVYGIVNPEWWRFLEHAGWVAFEDVVLFLGCRRKLADMQLNANREATLESVNTLVETQVRERTAELDASREQYRALVETTSAIAWEMDTATGQFLYVGPQAVHTFGHPLEMWHTGAILDQIHPDDRARCLEAIAAARANPKSFDIEYRLIAADGRTVSVRSAVSATATTDGRVLMRGLTFDLTAQRELELELQQAQKLESVGRLAAGIAHEINTPIQFVSDNCHFLRDATKEIQDLLHGYQETHAALTTGALTLEAATTQIAALEDKADLAYLTENIPTAIDGSLDGLTRVATIVRSMKQFAHPEQKERILANINEAVMSTLTIARNEYKYVAELTTDFGDLPLVPCYLGDLNQAVLNIVVNAAHAIADVVDGTDARGEITVRTWQEGDRVCISIRDTGGGIPEDVRARIFDPFFTTKEVGRGTGQGLAIARAVVLEKHGGTIEVESETGRGSTFTIGLPLPLARDLDAVA